MYNFDVVQVIMIGYDMSIKTKEYQVDENTAAICGLFCGDCGLYRNECYGCFSDKVAEHCVDCDFRDCAKEHKVVRCYECKEFPCKKLKSFSTEHWENGICHHANVVSDLEYMKDHGVRTWVEKKIIESTCPYCGEVIYWYDKDTHTCKVKTQGEANG